MTLSFQPLPTFYRIETPSYSLETGRGGAIASLVIGGKEFLSNEVNGATRIPGFFGPRNLAYCRLVGPRRLSLSDGGAELEIACVEDGMEWTIHNSGNDAFDFQIALNAQVQVEANGSSATLSRGAARLKIQGFDRIDKEGRIISNAPPHQSTKLRFALVRE